MAIIGRGKGETVEVMNSPNKAEGINCNRGATFHKLSNEEMQDKIKKGLWLWCDEKFGLNHVCRNKQLDMLLVTEEDLSSYDGLLNCKGDTEKDVEEDKALQLSMLTMAGPTTKS